MTEKRKKSPQLLKKIAELYNYKLESSDQDEVDGIPDGIPDENDSACLQEKKEDSNLNSFDDGEDSHAKNSFKPESSYRLKHTLKRLDDLGQVRVHLVRARGLFGADFGGKSDPFATVSIGDLEFKSNLVKKDINPIWDEYFTFGICDVDDVLTVTVFDEDRFNDPEFLGRVQMPVFDMFNYPPNEDITLALKNKKLTERAKGHHPQLVIRVEIRWNQLRAALKTIRRRPPPDPETLKKSLLINNVQRCRRVIHFANQIQSYVQSCFDWEKPSRSLKAFILFETVVYFFHPAMIPAFFLGFILVYPMYASVFIIDWLDPYKDLDPYDDEDEEEKDPKDEKKSLSDKYKAIQEVTTSVQNTLGAMASTAERFKNVLTSSTPFMSRLAMAFLVLATVLLYMIPFRAIVMFYGVNKFSKKLLRPDHVPSSEFLNFLSRMPDDVKLERCKAISVFDQELVKEEEEERLKRERSTPNRLVKKVSSFFNKENNATTSSSAMTKVD